MDASIALGEVGFENVDFRFRHRGCHAPKSKFDQAAQAIGGDSRIIREQNASTEGEIADGMMPDEVIPFLQSRGGSDEAFDFDRRDDNKLSAGWQLLMGTPWRNPLSP